MQFAQQSIHARALESSNATEVSESYVGNEDEDNLSQLAKEERFKAEYTAHLQ